MLTLSSSWIPDVLTESLANLASILQPKAGPRPSPFVAETARGGTVEFLRCLRDHLHEKGLLRSALSKVHAPSLSRLQDIEREHRLLKQLSHGLCFRIRTQDTEGAADVTHRMLAILIDHIAHERRVLTEVVAALDPAGTRRFGDVLFDQMIRGARKEGPVAHSLSSVLDLNSRYLRLLQHVEISSPVPPKSERIHEHACS